MQGQSEKEKKVWGLGAELGPSHLFSIRVCVCVCVTHTRTLRTWLSESKHSNMFALYTLFLVSYFVSKKIVTVLCLCVCVCVRARAYKCTYISHTERERERERERARAQGPGQVAF